MYIRVLGYICVVGITTTLCWKYLTFEKRIHFCILVVSVMKYDRENVLSLEAK